MLTLVVYACEMYDGMGQMVYYSVCEIVYWLIEETAGVLYLSAYIGSFCLRKVCWNG